MYVVGSEDCDYGLAPAAQRSSQAYRFIAEPLHVSELKTELLFSIIIYVKS